MAQKMGMRPNVAGRQPVNEEVLTFTLGVISITPLEMANIGSTIAGGGIHHDPIFVQKVVGADGKVVFDETGRPGERVLDPDVVRGEHPPRPARSRRHRRRQGDPGPWRSGRRARTTTRSAPRSSRGRPTSCRSSPARQSRRGRTRRRVPGRSSEHDLAQLHDPGDPGRLLTRSRVRDPPLAARRQVHRPGQGTDGPARLPPPPPPPGPPDTILVPVPQPRLRLRPRARAGSGPTSPRSHPAAAQQSRRRWRRQRRVAPMPEFQTPLSLVSEGGRGLR